jgi:hypothetical protein
MPRCVFRAAAVLGAALACSLTAQAGRMFPPTALRGDLQVEQPPLVRLNGREAMLAPGARIRGETNMIQLSGTLVGQRLVVNYTREPSSGMVKDVWVLTPDERARRPWPTTPEEAAKWLFDPGTQTWNKP